MTLGWFIVWIVVGVPMTLAIIAYLGIILGFALYVFKEVSSLAWDIVRTSTRDETKC